MYENFLKTLKFLPHFNVHKFFNDKHYETKTHITTLNSTK